MLVDCLLVVVDGLLVEVEVLLVVVDGLLEAGFVVDVLLVELVVGFEFEGLLVVVDVLLVVVDGLLVAGFDVDGLLVAGLLVVFDVDGFVVVVLLVCFFSELEFVLEPSSCLTILIIDSADNFPAGVIIAEIL